MRLRFFSTDSGVISGICRNSLVQAAEFLEAAESSESLESAESIESIVS